MEQKVHKLGIIGYGNMAFYHHTKIQKPENLAYIAAYDTSPARLAKAKENGLQVYDDLEAFLSCEDLEAVLVATPNHLHYRLALAALEHGKHVICEKPATLTGGEFSHLMKVAQRKGLLLTTHQNRRMDKDYLMIKQVLQEGTLGKVFRIESRVEGSRGIADTWRRKKEFGGGMLYDWGIHIIDQACMILGYDVKSVRCTFDHITNNEVDDGFQLWIEYKSGKKAYLEVGTYNFIPMPRFYMRATQGSAIITDWRVPAHVVKCKAWHESDVLPVVNASGLTKTMAPRDSVTVDEYDIERPASDVHDYYRNFVRAIDGLEEQMVTHDQMRCILKIIMTAFESVENGGNKVIW